MTAAYERTLSAALAFAAEGRVEEWVHAYLRSDGRNVPFSDGLKLFPRVWRGPAKIPLSLLTRICGPEEGMRFRVAQAEFEERVSRLAEEVSAGADMPPMIVHCTKVGLELNDGNHRLEAYRRLGLEEGWAIFWATEGEEDFFPPFLTSTPRSDTMIRNV